MSGYFTIAHAAEKLGVPEPELIEAAEAGRITLVHLLRRQHHAPRVRVVDGVTETVQAFPVEWFDGDARMQELEFRDILPAIVPRQWIYQLSQGESIWTNGAEVYGLGHRVFLWYPEKLLSLAACRVPAAELEKPAEPKERTKRNRHDRLRCAIVAALKVKPDATADELFDWMGENDETGTIVDYTDEKLVWEDTRRLGHDINRETFANRVSRIRAKTD